MLSEQTLVNLIGEAAVVVERAEQWRRLVDSDGDDYLPSVEAREILGDRFYPVWNQVKMWHAVHRHETYWEDLEGQNPRVAKAAREFSETVLAAERGLFPVKLEAMTQGEGRIATPDLARRNWQTQDRMKQVLEKLRAELEQGPQEVWIPASVAAKHAKELGPEVGLSMINRLVKQGKIKGRDADPGSKHRLEVEVGSFFRWFFINHRSAKRP